MISAVLLHTSHQKLCPRKDIEEALLTFGAQELYCLPCYTVLLHSKEVESKNFKDRF